MVDKYLLQTFGGYDGRNYDAIVDYEAPAYYYICGKYRDSLHIHLINDAFIRHGHHMLLRIYYRQRE